MSVTAVERVLAEALGDVGGVVTDRLPLPAVNQRVPEVRVEFTDGRGSAHAARVYAWGASVSWSSFGAHRFLGGVEDFVIEVMLHASRSRGASTLRVANEDYRRALAVRELPLYLPLASRGRAATALEALGVDRATARAVSDVIALHEVGVRTHDRARPFLEAALSGAPVEWAARRVATGAAEPS